MSINKRLISTGAGAITCTTDSTDPFGDSSGVALYNLDYDASTAPDGTDYSGSPTNVEFGAGGKINYGARFDGSSSKIDLNSLSTVLDAQSIVSVSFWFKSSSTALSGLFSYRGSASSAVNMLVTLNRSATGDVGLDSSTSGAFVNLGTYNGTYNDDNWHHVVSTINYSTGAFNVYIDKTLRITGTNTSLSRGTADKVQLGTNYGAQFINGDLDQVRIFSKALSTDEVDTLFVESPCAYECTTDDVNYPFSDGTNVEAYYKLDNSSEDYVGGNDGLDTNVEYTFGRFGQAAVFNGSSSKILPSSSPIPSSGAFTVSAWVKTSVSNHCFISFGDFWLKAEYLSGVFSLGDLNTSFQGTTDISDGNWHHCVLTVDNSNNIALYVDGTSEDTGTSTISRTNGGSFVIGVARNSSPVYYFNGSIDQVRIYSTALTSSQVTELYEEKPCADTSNFKAVLYEGNGGTQYISNVGFDLDADNGGDGGLVWIKARSSAIGNVLIDSVRGASELLQSETTSLETTYAGVTSFDANGFTVNGVGIVGTNANTVDYVAWAWKSGGEAVQNNDGTIQGANCMVSANTEAGFSIVKYTGTSTSGATIGHGLDNPPEMVILKNLDSSANWYIYHKDTGTTSGYINYLKFDATTGSYSDKIFYPVNFNSSTLTPGYDSVLQGNMIAYCFHSVAGYSKIGSYTGNLSGVSVTTGFNPSFVMIKRSDSTGNWFIYDSARSNGDTFDDFLHPNLSAAETTNNSTFEINATATGFNVVGAGDGQTNASGGTFIYMAFK